MQISLDRSAGASGHRHGIFRDGHFEKRILNRPVQVSCNQRVHFRGAGQEVTGLTKGRPWEDIELPHAAGRHGQEILPVAGYAEEILAASAPLRVHRSCLRA